MYIFSKKSGRTFLLFLIGVAIPISVPVSIIFAVDPFFVFHKKFSAIGFDDGDRYQDAGLINSFLADPESHIDTIIIGSSMSQNLPVAAFKNAYGVNALKLTLSGGKPRELAAIANKAIATGRVKKVIWEVHTSYIYNNPDALHEAAPLPLYLYNSSRWDDLGYVFNNDVFDEALRIIKRTIIKKAQKRRSLEDLYSWKNEDAFEKWSSPENLIILHERLNGPFPPITKAPAEIASMKFPNIDRNLLPILKNNPQTEFEIFFPPVSYYAYADSKNDAFWQQMVMRKLLLEETKNLKNVHIYGFDFIKNGPQSVNNYMDVSHYTPEISKRLADYIVQEKYILHAKDYDAYEQKLKNAVNDFVRDF